MTLIKACHDEEEDTKWEVKLLDLKKEIEKYQSYEMKEVVDIIQNLNNIPKDSFDILFGYAITNLWELHEDAKLSRQEFHHGMGELKLLNHHPRGKPKRRLKLSHNI